MNQVMVRPQTQVQAPLANQIADAREFAELIVKAGMAPECYGGKPEALAVAMLRGAEMGITYSESVGNLYVVKGQVSLNTKALVYMFEKHGGRVELLEWDTDHCKVRLSQRGRAPLVVQFTLAECKQAGWNLKSDGSEKYQWSKMPRIMVKNRTITNGIKAYSPTSEFVRTFEPEMADEATDELEAGDDSIESPSFRVVESQPVATSTKTLGVDDIPDEDQKPIPGAGFSKWPIPKQNRFTKFMSDHGLNVAATCEELDVKTLNDWQYSSGQTAPIMDALSYQDTLSLPDKKAALRIIKLAQIVWFGFTAVEIKEAIDAYIADKVTDIQVEAVVEQEGMAI